MEIAIVILSAAFIAAAVTAIVLAAKLDRERTKTAKLSLKLENDMNLTQSLIASAKENHQERIKLCKREQELQATVRGLEDKAAALRVENEKLTYGLEDAENAIVEACLKLNNFNGNSKTVAEAREILKNHIKENGNG